MYRVLKRFLIGKIEGFPIEIVRAMVERQHEQGNERDVTVFQRDILNGFSKGGFNADKTKEGSNFWQKVLIDKNFDIFFEKYPKQDTHIYYRGVPKRGKEIIEILEKLGGYNSYLGRKLHCENEYNYYFINPENKRINSIPVSSAHSTEEKCIALLLECYTEKFLPGSEEKETINIDNKTYVKEEVLKEIRGLKEFKL